MNISFEHHQFEEKNSRCQTKPIVLLQNIHVHVWINIDIIGAFFGTREFMKLVMELVRMESLSRFFLRPDDFPFFLFSLLKRKMLLTMLVQSYCKHVFGFYFAGSFIRSFLLSVSFSASLSVLMWRSIVGWVMFYNRNACVFAEIQFSSQHKTPIR